MEIVTLFYEERPGIKISMTLYFNEKGELCFDGYDIGKLVKDVWGDSDYEYNYIIAPGEVEKFYNIFGLKNGDQHGLLMILKDRFSVNEAYSIMGEFMRANNIDYRAFTWY